MGRLPRHQSLGVWANGVQVGRWVVAPHKPDAFFYDRNWAESPAGRPLSLSLPIPFDDTPIQGDVVRHFFDNLLPDSDVIRERLQARFRTDSAGTFDLLQAIGRECVGAVQLLPAGEVPSSIHDIQAKPLSEQEVAQLLRGTAGGGGILGQRDDDDFRISIAGAQEKTALLWHGGQWCKPLGATPTTHIFKLPLGLVGNRRADMRTSVENEWLCATLLSAFGLSMAECQIARFEDQKALVVTRFDRKRAAAGHWLRLPQEDFCQVTGLPSSRKYEAEGGPGVLKIGSILQQSETPEHDLHQLMQAQLLFWMLAATDGHAKNFSIFLLPGGRYRLTPLYDVLSAWPVAGKGPNLIDPHKLELAMALHGKNVHYRLKDIQRRHFGETARRCGLGGDRETVIDATVARVRPVLDEVAGRLPKDFPEDLFSTISQGMLASAEKLARTPRGD